MTPLFARLAHREARTSAQTLWNPGKRKRGDWVCRTCRTSQHARYHSEDGSRPPGPSALPHDAWSRLDDEASSFDRPRKSRPEERSAVRRGWGRGAHDGETRRPQPWANGSPRLPSRKTTALESSKAEEQAQWELWEKFEQAEEAGMDADAAIQQMALGAVRQEQAVEENGPSSIHADHDLSLLDVDYKGTLPDALLKREGDLVARCLLAASRAEDSKWLQNISENTFSEILALLQPSNSVLRLLRTHVELSEVTARFFNIAPVHVVASEHAKLLYEICALRRSVNVKLTLADYTTLLRSARDLGHSHMAVRLWNDLHADGYAPNIDCWNHYMTAVVWRDLFRASTRQRLRITPFNATARRARRLGSQFTAHRIGPGGVQRRVTTSFSKMLRDGAIANEESFRIVITAAAREGDMSLIKSVLVKVWGIDVDALLAGQDEDTIRPKSMPADSALHPTSKLLFTLAHAFAINNDIPAALRIVDFVARQYDLNIGHEVWEQLFEWTFVLAVPRTGVQSRADGSRTGKLPEQSVLHLWETMTGAPYFVQPTMSMYNRLMKILFYRDRTPMMVDIMEQGRQIYLQSKDEAQRLWLSLRQHIGAWARPDARSRLSLSPGQSLEQLRADFEHADLIRKRNLFWLQRWLRLALATMRTRALYDVSGDWALRVMPRLLWEWRALAPTTVRMETPGGLLEFDIRTEQEMHNFAVQKQRLRASQADVFRQIPKYVGQEWLRPAEHWPLKRLRDESVSEVKAAAPETNI